MGIEVVVGDPTSVDFGATSEYSGVLLQYPSTYGAVDTAAVEKIVAQAKATCVPALPWGSQRRGPASDC